MFCSTLRQISIKYYRNFGHVINCYYVFYDAVIRGCIALLEIRHLFKNCVNIVFSVQTFGLTE
jgi:hypothetical protein